MMMQKFVLYCGVDAMNISLAFIKYKNNNKKEKYFLDFFFLPVQCLPARVRWQ